ncbi:AraC family transcriptional regulator [Actinomadura kijaniata]|uniref:AraC family transcriptional regulator n=1 Tax=Actinomadura kijaniata TaxID=46161 RepID=UPI003F1B6421
MDVLSDVLAAMRVGRPYAGRVRCGAPWGVRFPSDDSACCHVVLQGTCRLVLPDGPPLALGVGDVLLTAPGHGHALADRSGGPLVDFGPARAGDSLVTELDLPGQGAATDLLCVRYRLDRLRTHPLLAELPPVIHLPARLGRRSALRTIVDLLGEELWAPGIGTDALLASLMDMLLLYALRTWIDERPGGATTGLAVALTDPAIAIALQHLHHRPEHLWTVSELAALSGTARATFAKRFTSIVGQAPLAYLTWWRMTTAARLLHRTDVSLQAVVERCGSDSRHAFADAFGRE